MAPADGGAQVSELAPASRPCAECPWRRDVEPGQFPPGRYAALRGTTVGPGGHEARLDAALFACHKSRDGEEFACAGWLAAVGHRSLRVRLLAARGEIPAEALRPGEGWPPLFGDYDEMAEAQGG